MCLNRSYMNNIKRSKRVVKCIFINIHIFIEKQKTWLTKMILKSVGIQQTNIVLSSLDQRRRNVINIKNCTTVVPVIPDTTQNIKRNKEIVINFYFICPFFLHHHNIIVRRGEGMKKIHPLLYDFFILYKNSYTNSTWLFLQSFKGKSGYKYARFLLFFIVCVQLWFKTLDKCTN